MKTLAVSLLAGLSLVATSGVANAQDAPTLALQRAQTEGAILEGRERLAFTHYVDRQVAARREASNSPRMQRAAAAALLVNAGDCGAARSLAARDNDRPLLAWLTEVCGRGDTNVSLN